MLQRCGAAVKGAKQPNWSRVICRRKYFSIPEAQEYRIIPKGRGGDPHPHPPCRMAIFLPMRPRVRGRERSLVGSDKGLLYCEGERALKDITKGRNRRGKMDLMQTRFNLRSLFHFRVEGQPADTARTAFEG
ncbi:uncharacterized protein CDAR_213261 [Caerostris darwini]|uniref:Uncharacterized protein n=1 Tax=Caerostris darwini TaxID=1538125 RepID=A0AAV4PWZ8_9ARAC|nr:uncharacterized protein CDAR_213261 [Caerostris darwini]